jgi:hypothetical protein
MIPSAARHASATAAGNVVPSRFNRARPISCISNERPSANRWFKTSRISHVEAEISGPMPSPGNTTSRMSNQPHLLLRNSKIGARHLEVIRLAL